MLKVQNWKIKLVYIGFGSLFGCLFTIIGMLASPVTAQRDKFGEIECRALNIVDANGEVRAVVGEGENGGFVNVYDKYSQAVVALNADIKGQVQCREMRVVDSGAKAKVVVWSTSSEGRVDVFSDDVVSWATLSVNDDGGRITEHGGHVEVHGKGKGAAVIGINEYGDGAVSTWDKSGYRQ